ncbi:WD domain, G-beta repeat protein [Ancylostoma ceylanicum]|uniref:WD domain, G-beta repeat protein n=1 Tax=Ancylostoma ceylanicum TaxID=53326 RepID=A0A0D6LGV2_9BILA|nr:WD domain, G-beta repeat protein [Ancylostoma ceylanicum]
MALMCTALLPRFELLERTGKAHQALDISLDSWSCSSTMASSDSGGDTLNVDSNGQSSASRQKWNTINFIENVRMGAIKGHLGVPHVSGDDMRVFVWRVADLMLEEAPKPAIVMERGSELFSGGNDGVVVRHDVVTHKPLSVHEERHPVYSISANPIDVNVVAASRESGVVAFYDRRESKEGSFCLIDEGQLFRGQYNPANALFFATASNRGIRLYDLRNRKKALLDLRTLVKEAIYVEWNSTGTALAALQSHSDPTYIDLTTHTSVELRDPEYSNVHTIKSVTFMDDSTVMTGSDDFNIYAWQVPHNDGAKEENTSILKASFILKGHRSIVNHVRYSPSNRIITSCGVEKIVKVWSSLPIPYSYDKPRIRVKKTYLSELSFDEGLVADDTAEDLNMLNYFDQLDNVSKPQHNYVVNVDLEGLRAHLMGLETSDEGSVTEGNDDDGSRAEDEVRDGDPEDEDSLRGALRAFRRRRWRMIRNSERRTTGSTVESLPSASQAEANEREDIVPSSDEDESEGPRKRVKRDTGQSSFGISLPSLTYIFKAPVIHRMMNLQYVKVASLLTCGQYGIAGLRHLHRRFV